MNRNPKPFGQSRPYWQLESTYGSGTSYSLSGPRNYSQTQPLKSNCSQRMSSAEFRGSILNPVAHRSGGDPLNVTNFPFVSGQFNNRSASLRVTGKFVGGDRASGDRDTTVHLGGPITISFLGEIDELRSDVLLPNKNGTPLWNRTLGFEKQLYGNAASSIWAERLAFWACVFAATATFWNL